MAKKKEKKPCKRGDEEIDFAGLEHLFTAMSSKTPRKEGGAAKTPRAREKVSLLDSKKSQAYAIALSGLKQFSYDQIRQEMMNGDVTHFSSDMLETFIKNAPDDGEWDLLRSYSENVAALGDAERFLIEMSRVQHYKPKLEAMLFRKTFTARMSDLHTQFDALRAALDVLGDERRCRMFRRLLRRLLAIGNHLNGTSARAFKIPALKIVCEMKAPQDLKCTLLQFLVRDVCDHAPELCGFVDELEPVHSASQFCLTQIGPEIEKVHGEVKGLLDDLESVYKDDEAFFDSMASFLESAQVEVESLQKELEAVTLQAADVLAAYGEDSRKSADDDPLQNFLTIIRSFVRCWKDAYNQKVKEDERKRRAEEHKSQALERSRRRSNTLSSNSASPASGALTPVPIASTTSYSSTTALPDQPAPARRHKTAKRRMSVVSESSSHRGSSTRLVEHPPPPLTVPAPAASAPAAAPAAATDTTPKQAPPSPVDFDPIIVDMDSPATPAAPVVVPRPAKEDSLTTTLLSDVRKSKRIRSRTKRSSTTVGKSADDILSDL